MYKYRLQKWGLDKKFREREVIQIALLKKERDDAGKRSQFFIRGRLVHWDLVERYLQRRPDLQMRIRAGMLTMGDPVSDLVCRSPSPGPVRHASPVLQYSDELLRMLRGYYEAFGADTESPTPETNSSPDLSTSIRCYRRLNQAQTMIMAERMAFGFNVLNQSLDDLWRIVKTQDATLLFYLCDVALAFDHRHLELVSAVLRHTHDILASTLKLGHPLVWMLRRLIALQDKDRYDFIATILEGVVGTLRSSKSASKIVERINCHYYLLLNHLGLHGRYTNASFPDIQPGAIDDVSSAYLTRLADRLILNGDLEEADAKLDLVHTWTQVPQNRQHPSWPDIQLSYYHLKAHGHFAQHKWKEGKQWLDKVIAHSNRYFPDA